MTKLPDTSRCTEHYVLFKGEMVRGIRLGWKTMTRRVITVKRDLPVYCDSYDQAKDNNPAAWEFEHFYASKKQDPLLVSHFINPTRGKYVVGNVLWVKETWGVAKEYDKLSPRSIPPQARSRTWYAADGPKPDWVGRTRSSMFMPRWASRFDLTMTEVRVERLKQITEEDARAEGVARNWSEDLKGYDPDLHGFLPPNYDPEKPDASGIDYYERLTALEAFYLLWDSINGNKPGFSVNSNPWVYVVVFDAKESAPPPLVGSPWTEAYIAELAAYPSGSSVTPSNVSGPIAPLLTSHQGALPFADLRYCAPLSSPVSEPAGSVIL